MNTTYIKKPDILKWYIYKILLIMRLTTVILMISMLQVSASTVAQEFNYVKKGASLIQIFKEIKKQTGYNIIWNEKKIDVRTTIDANFKKATIHDVLNKCLSNLPLSYSINDKMVMIKENEPSFRKKLVDFFNFIDVKGKVVNENGQPLVGATVKVKGTGQSTRSNEKGEFQLSGVEEKAILVISYLGYKTLEIAASGNVGIVKLSPSTGKLEEVEINAGYYTVKEKELTGSIARVTAETIAKQPVTNPLAALIGRMAGVNIEQQSGTNGGGYAIEIRGRNSLRSSSADNGNYPLYLIDGVPFPASSLASTSLGVTGVSGLSSPLNYISTADIESIEILKDADATAIYGSRGANGVVLIRTKRAKAGKRAIDFNVSTGISRVNNKFDLLNTAQYLEVRDEAFKNDGVAPGPTDYDVNGTWQKDRYTNWQDELIGGKAHQTNLQASISGGSTNTQFSFRTGFIKQSTVFPTDVSNKKGSGALTIHHSSLNDKLKLDLSTTYHVDQNSLPRTDLTQFIYLAPNAPAIENEDGSLNWALNSSGAASWANPVASIIEPYSSKSKNLIANGVISYAITPELTMKSNLGYTNLHLTENILNPLIAQAPTTSARGIHQLLNNTVETWILEPQINYKKKVGGGYLDALVGLTFQNDNQNIERLLGLGYTSDLLLKNINAAPTKNLATSNGQYKYTAVFGRLNYNYLGKYIVNMTGRRDGSSRFGPDKQFANFGAIGMAWIFSEEKFMKEQSPILSFGKLRASYGLTGSDQIANYGYLETYSATQLYQNESGLFPTRIANPDYSWETNKKLEVALELGFLRDKLMINVNYYQNRSSNQLIGYTLPDITGFPSIQANLPATVENKGWELELSTTNITTNRFTWKSSVNLTIPKNRLLAFPNIAGSTYANTYTVGESLYTPRGFHYLGVNPQTGLYTFEDLDGNGNDLDLADRRSIGKALTSHWYGGFLNTISYKQFSLDVFLQLVNKTVKDPLLASFNVPGSSGNQPTEILDRWQNPGDEKEIQKFSRSSLTNAGNRFFNLFNSDQVADASFVRLKNVAIVWNAPTRWLGKLKVNSLRIYLQAQNLFTITNYIGDPEVVNMKILPTLATISTGIQVSL